MLAPKMLKLGFWDPASSFLEIQILSKFATASSF